MKGVAVSKSKLRITWKAIDPQKRNGKIEGYRVYYLESGRGQKISDAATEVAEGKERSVTLSGLKTWTDYNVWVKAFTKVGEGPGSDPITVRTDEDGR